MVWVEKGHLKIMKKHEKHYRGDINGERGTFNNGTMGSSKSVCEVSKGEEEYVLIGGKCLNGDITGEWLWICVG